MGAKSALNTDTESEIPQNAGNARFTAFSADGFAAEISQPKDVSDAKNEAVVRESARTAAEPFSADNAAGRPEAAAANPFKQKILLAQQAQAESQKREYPRLAQENAEKNILSEKTVSPEKKIPIDAENIIRLPVLPETSDAFGGTDFDYADDEERLAGAVRTEQAFPAFDLFSEQAVSDAEKENIDWHEFLAYCEQYDFPAEYVPLMQGLKVTLTKTHCFIKMSGGPQAAIFTKVKNQLEQLLCAYLQRDVVIQSSIVAYELTSDDELREKALNNPRIQLLMHEFGAEIYRCYDIKHGRKN